MSFVFISEVTEDTAKQAISSARNILGDSALMSDVIALASAMLTYQSTQDIERRIDQLDETIRRFVNTQLRGAKQ